MYVMYVCMYVCVADGGLSLVFFLLDLVDRWGRSVVGGGWREHQFQNWLMWLLLCGSSFFTSDRCFIHISPLVSFYLISGQIGVVMWSASGECRFFAFEQ